MWEFEVVVKGDVLFIVPNLLPPPSYPNDFRGVFEKGGNISGCVAIVGGLEGEVISTKGLSCSIVGLGVELWVSVSLFPFPFAVSHRVAQGAPICHC